MEAGQKLTIFSLNMIAMTSRSEVTFIEERPDGKITVQERPKPRQRKLRAWIQALEKDNGTLEMT